MTSVYAVALAAAAVTALILFVATALAFWIGKKFAAADCVQLRVTNRELMQRRLELLRRVLDEIAHEATRLAAAAPEPLRLELQKFTSLTEAAEGDPS